MKSSSDFEIRDVGFALYNGSQHIVYGVFFKPTDERVDVPWNSEHGAVYDDCEFWIRRYGYEYAAKWAMDNIVIEDNDGKTS